jgi:hypothetical protein
MYSEISRPLCSDSIIKLVNHMFRVRVYVYPFLDLLRITITTHVTLKKKTKF